MACNLPIISVNVGDVNEVIKNTLNCFLVDYSDSEIAEKLKIIYDNRLPSNGREKISQFNDEIIAKKIIQIYEETLVKY
jgi:glycosyltransferase involved in cell wall biosynthesis